MDTTDLQMQALMDQALAGMGNIARVLASTRTALLDAGLPEALADDIVRHIACTSFFAPKSPLEDLLRDMRDMRDE